MVPIRQSSSAETLKTKTTAPRHDAKRTCRALFLVALFCGSILAVNPEHVDAQAPVGRTADLDRLTSCHG